MVHDKVKVKDKHRRKKKASKIFLLTILITAILALTFYYGYRTRDPVNQVTIENPLKNIVFENTNEAGEVNKEAVIQQGILEFNEEYIIYLLATLGVNHLHKSYVGYGNAELDLSIDQEAWSAEIGKGLTVTKKPANDPDLRITMSRQTAVEALLSSNIQEYLKTSVKIGNTQLEQIAGKVELGSKGYLSMYQELTGEVIAVE